MPQVQAKQKEIAEERRVSIPENIQAQIEGTMIKIKGPKGEVSKQFAYHSVSVAKSENGFIVSTQSHRKKHRAVVGAFSAHLSNMIHGVTNGFKYKLKIVYSHFPITTKVSGNILEIHNFLGEKSPRKAKIFGEVKVNAGKEEVVIEGINLEEVSQTAANIESATRVVGRDIRIFQDGIYIVSRE